MGFDSIVKHIESLPPLPESVRKIERLYAQGDPDMRALVKIVEEDPVLTADILARVNSPLYSFSKNMISVMQAATLFGTALLRGFILSSYASNTFKIDMNPYGVSNETFQEVSILQSAIMFQWYMGVDVERAKRLIPISFLMEMGKVIIAKEVAESSYVKEFLEMLDENGTTETERIFTDMTSAEVAALLFEHWSFNEIYINSMRYLDDPIKAPEEYVLFVEALDVVRTCVNVKEIMSEKSFKEAKQKVMQYGLPLDRFIHTVERLQRKRDKD